MRNATIQTHKECADKIRDLMVSQMPDEETLELMTRAALALDVLDKIQEIIDTPGVKDQYIGRMTRQWLNTANNIGDYYKEIRIESKGV